MIWRPVSPVAAFRTRKSRRKTADSVSRKNTPEEFHEFVEGQMKLWGKVVKDANIHLG